MRNVPDKSCVEYRNTHFVSSYYYFFLDSRAVHKIMWKNIVEPGRPQMTHAHCVLDT
jgi:hypothetical protein